MGARRTAWLLLALAAACYLAGYLLYPPRVLVNSDESNYVAQAFALAEGRTTLPSGSPFSAEEIEAVPSHFPPGTALLQAPFVRLGGWQSAPWASTLSLLATLFLLAVWLQDSGYSPLFGLIFLGYAPTLVMGRVAMSDLPSAAIVTAGLALFWRGQDRPWPAWFGAGLLAGLSFLFRPTNPLFFAPFFAGAVFRGERKALALVAGGLAGLGLRSLAVFALYGSALEAWAALPVSYYHWGWEGVWRNSGYVAIALLLLIPGGLVAAALYRGRRRAEVIATVFLVTALFLSLENIVESGELKRLILGGRYFVPLAPILAFAIAEVTTRRWAGLARDWKRWPVIWALAVSLAAFAVHPVLARWSNGQEAIVRAIYGTTPEGAALISNAAATVKFVNPVYGYRILAGLDAVPPERVVEVLRAHPSTYLVLNDRSDSDFFRDGIRSNAEYLARLEGRCRLTSLFDAQADPVDRVRIWKVEGCE